MLMGTWPARMGQSLVQGFMAPGNAYQSVPENPVTTEQMIGPAANLAGLAMTGAMPFGTGVGGTALGIVPVDVARRTGIKSNLPQSDIFNAAVAGTPGARIEEGGLTLPVMRSQQPDQAMAESVRGGVFYQPQRPGAYSYTGKNAYGGPESIKGETVVMNPLFVKGATGGKAPEMAYDQLLGKGSYQNMRSEALNVQRWGSRGFGEASRTDFQKTSEQARQFLDKYAPEMADLADHIVQNSDKGNQLAYALQEAAVGSAARKAGHDAILGYSVGRKDKQPFLSELFDVRENRYPSPSGDYSMWPQFMPFGK